MTKRDWIWPVDPELFELDMPDPEGFEDGPSEFNLELIRLLRKHFDMFDGFDEESFEWMAQHLVFDQAHVLDDFWSSKEVLEDLAKLRTRLKEAGDILSRLPMPVSDAFRTGALQKSGLLNHEKKVDARDDWFNDALSEAPHWKAMLAEGQFFKRLRHYVELIEHAEMVAANGVPVGKKAIEAWRLVAACVGLCERHPETIRVPKAMNEGGPFYRFLSDTFQVFGIEELPTSAFRSWKKHVGR
ncbi:MAG: hypothetical protein AB3N12_07225 [Ruegeria sp.]